MNNILTMVLFVIVTLITYNLLKIFVLSNLKINKWIILTLGIVVCALTIFIKVPIFIMCLLQWVYFVLILWFVDICVQERRIKQKNKNKKVMVNKPKVKPNRIKNNNNIKN